MSNNKRRIYCHIKRGVLKDFFKAVEKSAYTNNPVGPQDFFKQRQISRIAECEYCTYIVLRVYDLSAEYFSLEDMFEMLELALAIDDVKFFGNKNTRLMRLTIC